MDVNALSHDFEELQSEQTVSPMEIHNLTAGGRKFGPYESDI